MWLICLDLLKIKTLRLMNVKFYSDFLTFVVCVCTSLCIKIQDGGEKKKNWVWTLNHTNVPNAKKMYIIYRPALDLSARKHRLIHS